MERYFLLIVNAVILVVQILLECVFVKCKLKNDESFKLDKGNKKWYRGLFAVLQFTIFVVIIYGTIQAGIDIFLNLVDESISGIFKTLFEFLFEVNSGLDIVSGIVFAVVIGLTIYWDRVFSFLLKHYYAKHFLRIHKRRYFRIINKNKIRSCLHSDKSSELLKEEEIEKFIKFYIAKKTLVADVKTDKSLVKYGEIREAKKNSIVKEIEEDKDENMFLVLGDAGSGKSTLLIKTYIDICRDCSNKYFGLIFDLGHNDAPTLEVAIKKAINQIIDSNTYRLFCAFDIQFQKIEDKIYTSILKFRNNFFIFDSWDEMRGGEHKANFFKEISNINDSSIVLIGCRENSKIDFYDECDNNDIKGFNKVFKVRDFSEAEAYRFINNLASTNPPILNLSDEGFSKLQEALKLITFNNSINPFLANTIIHNFKNAMMIKRKENNVKLDRLLAHSIFELININYDFKPSLENYRFFQYIAIRGAGYYENVDEVASVVQNGIDNEKLRFIKERTYLIDKENKFYQKIFSDYYSARFLFYNSLSGEGTSERLIYDTIIRKIASNPVRFSDTIRYIPIVFDGYINEDNDGDRSYKEKKSQDSVKKIFSDLMREIKDDEKKNEKVIFIFTEVLKFLYKLSSESSIKDDKSIVLTALYDENSLTTNMYKLFLDMMGESKRFTYDDYLYIFSAISKHHLALKALSLIDDEKLKFTLLSALRDSYCLLNFDNNGQFRKDVALVNAISELSSHYNIAASASSYKKVSMMNYRELLNYVFYETDEEKINAIDNKNIENNAMNIFPSAMNIWNYLSVKEARIDNKEIVFFYPGVEEQSVSLSKLKDYKTFVLPFEKERKEGLLKPLFALYFLNDNSDLDILKAFNKDEEVIESIRSVDLSNNIEKLEDPLYFNGFINLVNACLPLRLKSIGSFAFYDCHYIKRIRIPDSVEFLGESFVEDCHSLGKINMPRNLKTIDGCLEIGNFAFENCSSLEEVDFSTIIDQDYERLNEGLFLGAGIVDVKSLRLSSKLKAIPKFSFANSKYLRSVDLSSLSSLERIDKYAFTNSSKVEEITLPASLREIDNLAFSSLDALKKVKILSSKIKISPYAFNALDDYKPVSNIAELKNLFATKRIQGEINENAALEMSQTDFYKDGISGMYQGEKELIIDYIFNKNIEEFDSDKINETYDVDLIGFSYDALSNCDFLDEVKLGRGVRLLCPWLFEDSDSLYKVDLSESSIEELPAHLFENCSSLTTIKLPSSLKLIDSHCFRGCRKIKEIITCENSSFIIHPEAFDKTILIDDLEEASIAHDLNKKDIAIKTIERKIIHLQKVKS